jgi:hypothetical protein
MRHIAGFGRFWYEFIIGDDWRLALTVVLTLVAVNLGAHFGATWTWFVLPVAILGALAFSLWRATTAQGL